MAKSNEKVVGVKQPSLSGMAHTDHLGGQASDQALQQGHTKVGREQKVVNDVQKLQAHKSEGATASPGVAGLNSSMPQPGGAKNANSVSKAFSEVSKSGSDRKRS